MTNLKKNAHYNGSAHPKSDELTRWAKKRLAKLRPNGKPRFGDARDRYLEIKATETNLAKIVGAFPCTSKGLSTMPRRERKAA